MPRTCNLLFSALSARRRRVVTRIAARIIPIASSCLWICLEAGSGLSDCAGFELFWR